MAITRNNKTTGKIEFTFTGTSYDGNATFGLSKEFITNCFEVITENIDQAENGIRFLDANSGSSDTILSNPDKAIEFPAEAVGGGSLPNTAEETANVTAGRLFQIPADQNTVIPGNTAGGQHITLKPKGTFEQVETSGVATATVRYTPTNPNDTFDSISTVGSNISVTVTQPSGDNNYVVSGTDNDFEDIQGVTDNIIDYDDNYVDEHNQSYIKLASQAGTVTPGETATGKEFSITTLPTNKFRFLRLRDGTTEKAPRMYVGLDRNSGNLGVKYNSTTETWDTITSGDGNVSPTINNPVSNTTGTLVSIATTGDLSFFADDLKLALDYATSVATNTNLQNLSYIKTSDGVQIFRSDDTDISSYTITANNTLPDNWSVTTDSDPTKTLDDTFTADYASDSLTFSWEDNAKLTISDGKTFKMGNLISPRLNTPGSELEILNNSRVTVSGTNKRYMDRSGQALTGTATAANPSKITMKDSQFNITNIPNGSSSTAADNLQNENYWFSISGLNERTIVADLQDSTLYVDNISQTLPNLPTGTFNNFKIICNKASGSAPMYFASTGNSKFLDNLTIVDNDNKLVRLNGGVTSVNLVQADGTNFVFGSGQTAQNATAITFQYPTQSVFYRFNLENITAYSALQNRAVNLVYVNPLLEGEPYTGNFTMSISTGGNPFKGTATFGTQINNRWLYGGANLDKVIESAYYDESATTLEPVLEGHSAGNRSSAGVITYGDQHHPWNTTNTYVTNTNGLTDIRYGSHNELLALTTGNNKLSGVANDNNGYVATSLRSRNDHTQSDGSVETSPFATSFDRYIRRNGFRPIFETVNFNTGELNINSDIVANLDPYWQNTSIAQIDAYTTLLSGITASYTNSTNLLSSDLSAIVTGIDWNDTYKITEYLENENLITNANLTSETRPNTTDLNGRFVRFIDTNTSVDANGLINMPDYNLKLKIGQDIGVSTNTNAISGINMGDNDLEIEATGDVTIAGTIIADTLTDDITATNSSIKYDEADLTIEQNLKISGDADNTTVTAAANFDVENLEDSIATVGGTFDADKITRSNITSTGDINVSDEVIGTTLSRSNFSAGAHTDFEGKVLSTDINGTSSSSQTFTINGGDYQEPITHQTTNTSVGSETEVAFIEDSTNVYSAHIVSTTGLLVDETVHIVNTTHNLNCEATVSQVIGSQTIKINVSTANSALIDAIPNTGTVTGEKFWNAAVGFSIIQNQIDNSNSDITITGTNADVKLNKPIKDSTVGTPSARVAICGLENDARVVRTSVYATGTITLPTTARDDSLFNSLANVTQADTNGTVSDCSLIGGVITVYATSDSNLTGSDDITVTTSSVNTVNTDEDFTATTSTADNVTAKNANVTSISMSPNYNISNKLTSTGDITNSTVISKDLDVNDLIGGQNFITLSGIAEVNDADGGSLALTGTGTSTISELAGTTITSNSNHTINLTDWSDGSITNGNVKVTNGMTGGSSSDVTFKSFATNASESLQTHTFDGDSIEGTNSGTISFTSGSTGTANFTKGPSSGTLTISAGGVTFTKDADDGSNNTDNIVFAEDSFSGTIVNPTLAGSTSRLEVQYLDDDGTTKIKSSTDGTDITFNDTESSRGRTLTITYTEATTGGAFRVSYQEYTISLSLPKAGTFTVNVTPTSSTFDTDADVPLATAYVSSSFTSNKLVTTLSSIYQNHREIGKVILEGLADEAELHKAFRHFEATSLIGGDGIASPLVGDSTAFQLRSSTALTQATTEVAPYIRPTNGDKGAQQVIDFVRGQSVLYISTINPTLTTGDIRSELSEEMDRRGQTTGTTENTQAFKKGIVKTQE